ncbi:MAG: hypothetical protein KAJ18_08450 [Candidatus Omnitrophica bacterium]|nr:hypothetical protein [Candidatus Omnitrophota bacterium]
MSEKEIIIDVTSKCVMNCMYCGTTSFSDEISNIDFELFKKIVNSLRYLSKTRVFLGGGTFFCHPEWKKMLELIKSNENTFVIDCPLEKNIINIICKNRPVRFNYFPSISLWGIGDEHDKLCGGNSFGLLDHYIRSHSKWGIPLHLSFVMTKSLIQQVRSLIEFMCKLPLGANIYFHRFMPVGKALGEDLPTMESLQDFKNEVLYGISKTAVAKFHHTLDGICKAAGNSRIFINHDGLVYKCGWINKTSVPIYNLHEKSIIDFNKLFQKATPVNTQCVLK